MVHPAGRPPLRESKVWMEVPPGRATWAVSEAAAKKLASRTAAARVPNERREARNMWEEAWQECLPGDRPRQSGKRDVSVPVQLSYHSDTKQRDFIAPPTIATEAFRAQNSVAPPLPRPSVRPWLRRAICSLLSTPLNAVTTAPPPPRWPRCSRLWASPRSTPSPTPPCPPT